MELTYLNKNRSTSATISPVSCEIHTIAGHKTCLAWAYYHYYCRKVFRTVNLKKKMNRMSTCRNFAQSNPWIAEVQLSTAPIATVFSEAVLPGEMHSQRLEKTYSIIRYRFILALKYNIKMECVRPTGIQTFTLPVLNIWQEKMASFKPFATMT